MNYDVERQRHIKQINYTQDSSFFRIAALWVKAIHPKWDSNPLHSAVYIIGIVANNTNTIIIDQE